MEVYISCDVCVCVRLCNKISSQGYCRVNHVTSSIVAFIVTMCIKRIVIYRVTSICQTTDTSFCSSSVSLNCLILSVIGQKIGHMILVPPTCVTTLITLLIPEPPCVATLITLHIPLPPCVATLITLHIPESQCVSTLITLHIP